MNIAISLGMALLLSVLIITSTEAEQKSGSNWNAPDRAQKVLGLRPGKRVPNLTPDTLFADWTKQQLERWLKEHPGETIAEVCERAAVSADGRFPSDAEIITNFPVQISPYGRLRSGKPDDPLKAERVLAAGPLACQMGYCPFCGSLMLAYNFDPANSHHATTTCCRKDIYDANYPVDYTLKPTTTVGFPDLDSNIHQVPAVIYKDRDGIEWELYVANVFANKRWDDMANLCTAYSDAFKSSADPAYAYKLAVILDKTADTYYGLLPSGINEFCPGKDGKPITRAEWEAVPRPCMFGPSYLGEWSRRGPLFSRGWLRQVNEAVWGEPFGRVRHHPAFKYYSQKVYGDPDALDKKVRQKLMREICMTWESVGGGLITDYQDAIYTNEMLVGALAERPAMLDFTASGNELTLYNHYYSDGLCGEGAANYMAMPGGYYFPPLMDPQGTWLSLYPDFLKENPFFNTANTQWQYLRTLRGLELEFGDEHISAFNTDIMTDKTKVKERESIPSMNWPGWGLGLLRIGGPGHRMEMTIDYTRVAQHTNSDQLGIACWVDGIPVMRPGGYGSGDPSMPFQNDRPEIMELKQMGYPKEIVEAKTGELAFGGWTHSPMAQNAITVNETFPSIGWSDNRGYGEVIAYKGGEKTGDPGARFQALEIRDRYTFERVGQPLSEYRRALLGVEALDGRPYIIDIMTVRGGQRHALYNSAWAERGEADLPAVKNRANSLPDVLYPLTGDRIKGDIVLPSEWTVFGPVTRDDPEPVFAKITDIPIELTIKGNRLVARKATLNKGRLDLGALLDGKKSGKTAYMFAVIDADKATEATIGAGADLSMKWWVNGKLACDTVRKIYDFMSTSNTDHIFNIRLRAGKNLIVAKIVSAGSDFVLTVAGPRELRQSPEQNFRDKIMAYVRNCEILEKPKKPWSLTWKTDYAAYAKRDPKKTPFVRPLPDDIGKVRLRFLGLPVPGQESSLISAKGPWVSIINQPMSDGTNLYGNVGFVGGTDMLVETRNTDKGKVSSRFVHIMEGYREGEESLIKTVEMLPIKTGSSSTSLTLKVTRTDGLADIIVYQETPKTIKLANGLTTDARYALVRLGADGNWTEANMVEGTKLQGLGMNFTGSARYTGTITDLAGDLTGNRHESALIIKPDKSWPASLSPGCRQMIVEGPNALRAPFREAYTLDMITSMEDGNLRLDIAGTPPLASGWHQVSELDPKRPNFFRTTRPMMFGSETPWYAGMDVWFPRLNKTFRFKDLTGGFHMCTEGLMDNVNLAAEGVKPGDWFVIHYLKPGLKVSLVNSMHWNR